MSAAIEQPRRVDGDARKGDLIRVAGAEWEVVDAFSFGVSYRNTVTGECRFSGYRVLDATYASRAGSDD